MVIDAQPFGGGPTAVGRLERDGIYIGTCRLPWQTPESPAEGVRIGVQEFVRRGAGFDTVADLANLLYRSLTGSGSVAKAARNLRQCVITDLWGRSNAGAGQ